MITDATNATYSGHDASRIVVGNNVFYFSTNINVRVTDTDTVTVGPQLDDCTITFTGGNYEPSPVPVKAKNFRQQAPGYDEYLAKSVTKILTRSFAMVHCKVTPRRHRRRGGAWTGKQYHYRG